MRFADTFKASEGWTPIRPLCGPWEEGYELVREGHRVVVYLTTKDDILYVRHERRGRISVRTTFVKTYRTGRRSLTAVIRQIAILIAE